MLVPSGAFELIETNENGVKTVYFADPKFIGKGYMIEDMTTIPNSNGDMFKRRGKPVDFPIDPEMSDIERKLLESEGYDVEGTLNPHKSGFLEFYAYETLGGTIAHPGAISRVDFA